MPEVELTPSDGAVARTSRRFRYLAAASVAAVLVISALGVVWAMTRTPAAPECAGAQSLDFNCFVSRYEALTRASGARAALRDLAERGRNHHYLVAACHQLTHVIGRTAGEIHGGAVAYAQGADLCASGYYHGVTEAMMMRVGAERIVEQAQAVCGDHRQRERYSYLHYNCVHGMGHGFMAVFASDVFRSLEGCDALPDPWERHHCFGGVFMENLTAMRHPSRPSSHLRPDEPLYPCTAVDRRYKADCYMKQTAYALHVRQEDFGAVFRLCRAGPDVDFRAVCYQGLGGDAAIMSSKYVIGARAQTATLRKLCLQGPDEEARSNCVVGAVNTMVRDRGGDDTRARAFCAILDDRELGPVCEVTRMTAAHGVPAPEGTHRH